MTKNSVPEGWTTARIGDVVAADGVFCDGDWVESKDQDPEGDVRLTQLADVGDGEWRNRSDRYLTSGKARQLGCTFLAPSDVLIARMPDPLGRACVFPGDDMPCVTAVDVCIVRPGQSGANASWLMHAVNSPYLRGKIASLQSGSTRKRISRGNLATIEFPVPSLPEQKRIVAKIEELFSDLDAGVETLKKLRTLIKRYRQSVLKAAFEGKLTEEWREQHKHELEPASVLLERIREERKKKAKEEGKKYKEPPPVDTTDLPELPEGWEWGNFDTLARNTRHAIKAGPFGSTVKKSFYVPSGYKIYGQEQVIRGDACYGDYYIDENRYTRLASCRVAPRDILISLVGTIGRVLILPDDIEPGIINPRLVKLSLDQRAVNNHFVKAYLESSAARLFFKLSSHGETMEILNLKILRSLPVPIPPLEEQCEIANRMEHSFSIADKTEEVLDQSLTRSQGLRQSILKRAFEGKLVPQDPNDEPAGELLERIKAEKAKLDAENRHGERRRIKGLDGGSTAKRRQK